MIFYILIVAVLLFALPWAFIKLTTASHIHPLAQAPGGRVAIVFGAGLQRDGTPSPILRDRVTTAADLYFAKKVEKILMSGDNRFVEYNEPGAMAQFAMQLGVPEEDIILDYAGRRTYDTCYRARDIFGVREAILVTQAFHLPRAVFTCRALGVPAQGVIADQHNYVTRANFREIPADLVALWDVWITHPLPVLGDPEPIFQEPTSWRNQCSEQKL